MRKLILTWSSMILSCGVDRTGDESWHIRDAIDMTSAHESTRDLDGASDIDSEDMYVELVDSIDDREMISCADDVLQSSSDFERIEDGWRRVFEPLEHDGAIYQAVLSLVTVERFGEQRRYVRITQRICANGSDRRAMWLAGSQSVLEGLPDDYPHRLRGGVFALADDRDHVFAPTCLQLLNFSGPVREELIPHPAYIEPGVWESFESDDNFAPDLSYPLSGWIDTDPRHADAEYYTRALDYEGGLRGRMYWPVLHPETFSIDESGITSPASVCLETGWPVDPDGFVTSMVDGAYVIQDLPIFDLPEEIHSIIREAKNPL